MIASLIGKITHVFNDSVVLEVGGIGYRIFLPSNFLVKIKKDVGIKIFTHEHIREDARDLYGFETIEDLKMFWKLLAVSGVGPKMASRIMTLGTAKIFDAIARGEIAILSSVTGVGKKTAQKIILELKGVLVETQSGASKSDEVIDALIKLGYSRKEAADAVSALPGTLEKTEERLKMALRNMGKK